MSDVQQQDFSYFPGCSMATTAAESNRSLMQAARILGLNLIELQDWNCCGSASAQTMCKNLSLGMAARNLSLAPPGRPLVAMCPRCLHYLRSAQICLIDDPKTREDLEEKWGRPIPTDLEIIHFMEVLVRYGLDRLQANARRSLKGLRFVPYYGCTLFRPPRLAKEKYFQGEMENILTALGAEAVPYALTYRCCGSRKLRLHRPGRYPLACSAARILGKASSARARISSSVRSWMGCGTYTTAGS